jgi:hypothetical protein
MITKLMPACRLMTSWSQINATVVLTGDQKVLLQYREDSGLDRMNIFGPALCLKGFFKV